MALKKKKTVTIKEEALEETPEIVEEKRTRISEKQIKSVYLIYQYPASYLFLPVQADFLFAQ